jgi:hypothetical protein
VCAHLRARAQAVFLTTRACRRTSLFSDLTDFAVAHGQICLQFDAGAEGARLCLPASKAASEIAKCSLDGDKFSTMPTLRDCRYRFVRRLLTRAGSVCTMRNSPIIGK